MREFRRRVERDAGLAVSPADPSEFLERLLDAVVERTERLRSVETTNGRPTDFAVDLARDSERAADRLEDIGGTPFDLVSVILAYDGSFMLHRRRELQAADDLSEESAEILENLESLLKDVHVTGLYFKTISLQQELADASKHLLYVGTMSLLYGGFIVISYENVLAFDPGRTVLALVVCLALTAAFAPFAMLISHVLRIATVARRTSADFGPFLLQRSIPDENSGTRHRRGYRRRDDGPVPIFATSNASRGRRSAPSRSQPATSTGAVFD